MSDKSSIDLTVLASHKAIRELVRVPSDYIRSDENRGPWEVGMNTESRSRGSIQYPPPCQEGEKVYLLRKGQVTDFGHELSLNRFDKCAVEFTIRHDGNLTEPYEISLHPYHARIYQSLYLDLYIVRKEDIDRLFRHLNPK